MKYQNILEEETKNKIAQDFFSKFDCTKILGKIDFAVKPKRSANVIDFADEYLLWAEAKQKPTDIIEMLSQLVLTIGKAKTFNEILPPPFLGCYDSEKIAFVPYSEIQDIFYQNDFNWKVTPSNTETKEFKQVYTQIKKIVENCVPWETYLFYFEKDEKELRKFIKNNFIVGKSETTKIRIDKNNFINVFSRWLDVVKPTIDVDWDLAKQNGIISGHFYLADLLSSENSTILEKLNILLKTDRYIAEKHKNKMGFFTESSIYFKDNQKAYNLFWAKYERPPHEDYWDYIIDRQDLLVPQDIREVKGSFYTPRIWVEKAQEYLTETFGEDWQEEYYIWDCAAGTGNLLAGLTNKYNIYASTLDKQDVDVMRQRIESGAANLLENHVFQFDFLNDNFDKLPQSLQNIIKDENKRKQLIIFINPPYVESGVYGTRSKVGVATEHKTNEKYKKMIGAGANDVYIQFYTRICVELPNIILATFSTLKYVNAPNCAKFRKIFKAEFKNGFICCSNKFDNVPGNFPIGFIIWNLNSKKEIKEIECKVFDNNGKYECDKKYYAYTDTKMITDWYRNYYNNNGIKIGILRQHGGADFQTNRVLHIASTDIKNHTNLITSENLKETCVYFAVRKVIDTTWLNNRDQFLFPNKKWEKDLEFQSDCVAYTIFNNQNRISAKDGVNHWLPFKEDEVNADEKFDSHFMTNFFAGKKSTNGDNGNLFEKAKKPKPPIPLEFSNEAKAVFDAGKAIWIYYHAQKKVDVNASYYDIRTYFKGFSIDNQSKKRMNNKSTDEKFNMLEKKLSQTLNILALKIETKVYEYGFLKK